MKDKEKSVGPKLSEALPTWGPCTVSDVYYVGRYGVRIASLLVGTF